MEDSFLIVCFTNDVIYHVIAANDFFLINVNYYRQLISQKYISNKQNLVKSQFSAKKKVENDFVNSNLLVVTPI